MQNEGKLNRLQSLLPDGLLVDAAWLENQGYSSSLRSKYVRGGWLQQLVRGVYRRPPGGLPESAKQLNSIRWQQVVISLQTLLEYPFAVGGRTALEIQGFGHYLSADSPREVHLYGDIDAPGWLAKLPSDSGFVCHTTRRLFDDHLTLGKHANARGSLRAGLTIQAWGQWGFPLIVSSPERAVLELLDELPARETFHQVDMIVEGLRNLSPRRLHQLLAACHSVKVKRLFLWFAERHNHAWLKALDPEGIDLGHGKRMIIRGGKLDKKYNITVPEFINAAI